MNFVSNKFLPSIMDNTKRSVNFPSYCELESDSHCKFALSRIHIRRMNHFFEALKRLPIHYKGGHSSFDVKKKGKLESSNLLLYRKKFKNLPLWKRFRADTRVVCCLRKILWNLQSNLLVNFLRT